MYQKVKSVSELAFDDDRYVVIYGKKGSYAQKYAKKAGIPFKQLKKLPALKGITYTQGNLKYKVIDDTINGKGKVMVVGAAKNAQAVTIGKTVKLESYNYTITQISAKAFYKQNKLKKVTIKNNVIKTIGSNAFKGINNKAVITVPKACFKSYQKLLKKAGVKGQMKIKKN